MNTLTQSAPYPTELEDLIARANLWPGWTMWLGDIVRDEADTHGAEGRGLTLIIETLGFNTYHPERGPNYRVRHYFIVPAATYNRQAWQRWLFDQYAKVFLHEAMESFSIDDRRPYAPHHGPGCDPYTVFEHGTEKDVQTSFQGIVKG